MLQFMQSIAVNPLVAVIQAVYLGADYQPKINPDTLKDYLKKPSKVYKILGEIGEPSINNLKTIMA